VLGRVPRVTSENVLVGYDTADDAGVYKLTPECALVQTVDFFTPIVDEPYTFGAITAANSLSDIYAMGARPISALSIVAYPSKGEAWILEDIMTGGAEKMREAGCVILGGHSLDDSEMKFGYAVTGIVHPDRILANAGARPGDVLLFTKRLGTGVIGTAVKGGIAREADGKASIASMLELNRSAGEAMLEFEVHGCTDVTGFGLVGHAREMAQASNVTIEIDSGSVQFLPGALDYARQGAIPGGLKNNVSFFACDVAIDDGIPEEVILLLHDPQTSGGLLVVLPEKDAVRYERKVRSAYRIGRIRERSGVSIHLL